MNVTITAIDQSYSLKTGQVESFVVATLPSGREVWFAVSEENVGAIIEESQNSQPQEPSSGTAAEKFVEDFKEELLHDIREATTQVATEAESQEVEIAEHSPEPEPELIEWATLDDATLPAVVKDVLKTSGVGPKLSVQDLTNLTIQILNHLKEAPAPGKVNWNTKNKRDQRDPWSNFKTVPRDEAGNPLPPGGIVEPDPGEGWDDDDGVGQL